MPSYALKNTNATISGPNGSFSLGHGVGLAEEGIDISPAEAKSDLYIGADGTPMFSLFSDQSGSMTFTVEKTSPVNQLLMQLYDANAQNSATWGQDTIQVSDSVSGDSHTGTFCAFKRKPVIKQAKSAGTNQWEFFIGILDSVLGNFN